jgi:hypothetical protein
MISQGGTLLTPIVDQIDATLRDREVRPKLILKRIAQQLGQAVPIGRAHERRQIGIQRKGMQRHMQRLDPTDRPGKPGNLFTPS